MVDIDKLKSEYNELLYRFKKGNEMLSEHPEYALELSKIQGKMENILGTIKNFTPEEQNNGFIIIKKQNNELNVAYKIDDEEIILTPKIVQEYIVGANAGKINNQEFMMFASLCKARKLNPFLKEAYCIKFSNNQPASIVVGKDAVLRRAILHPQYNGMENGIFVTDNEGKIIERQGTFKLPNETLVGAWAKVYRKDWEHPIYCSVTFDEVVQKTKDGKPNSNWTKQPAVMTAKVATVRALRDAFVEELGGMYEEVEMNFNEPEVKEARTIEDVL